jgi:predicted dehydrogenase
MEKLNIGIIGLGAIGQKHCDALKEINRANIVAVADVDESVLAKTANQLNATPYADFKRLIDHPGLDAVVVAMPDHMHREACVTAAEAGKHVLVEKPLATTLDDGKAIIAATEKNNVQLMVGFSLRFSLHYQKARDAVKEGKLGDLVSIFARRLNVITQSERINGRCGVLTFLGVHDFDAMRWIVGSEPVSIYSESSTSVPSPYPIENETFSIIRFENGVIGCAHIGWYLPAQHPAGRDFKLDITGNKGCLNLDQMRQGIEIYTQNGAKFPSVSTGLLDEDSTFVNCILDNKPMPATGKDGLIALKMVQAALESIKTHQSVKIESN